MKYCGTLYVADSETTDPISLDDTDDDDNSGPSGPSTPLEDLVPKPANRVIYTCLSVSCFICRDTN